MPKVTMLKGLPAAGKTTWAKAHVKNSQGKIKRINKDDLREMIDAGVWSKSNEQDICGVRDILLMAFLKGGFDVIVDDTNFEYRHQERIEEIAKRYNASVEVKMFNLPVEECILRDARRAKPVGEKVIRDMVKKYFFSPSNDAKLVEQVQQNPSLEKAIIVDVDGTLAIMKNRSPYEWHRVGEDEPNMSVVEVIRELAKTYKIIVVSGRDGSCAQQTREWLQRHYIPCHAFYMRPAGNTEKDYVIKKRFLDEIVQKYNVIMVFDDRNQVVDMWRKAGLVCSQVANGDF